jgi:hypothetical protein
MFEERWVVELGLRRSFKIFAPGSSLRRRIDWQAFRDGVGATLKSLYRDKYKIEFGKLDIRTYKSGEWNYWIPYRLLEPPKSP